MQYLKTKNIDILTNILFVFFLAIEKISQDIDSVDVLIADGRLIPKVLQHVQKVKWIHLIWAGKSLCPVKLFCKI